MSFYRTIRLCVTVLLLSLFVLVLVGSRAMPTLAGYLPFVIGLVGTLLCLLSIGIDVIAVRVANESSIKHQSILADEKEEVAPIARIDLLLTAEGEVDVSAKSTLSAAGYFLWLVLYITLVSLVGIWIATPTFLYAFLLRVAKTGWMLPTLGSIVCLGILWVLSHALDIGVPSSLLLSVSLY